MILNKENVKLTLGTNEPIYLQLSNRIVKFICCGILATGTKLPGSRSLAEELGINRMTVVSAYDELVYQGWIYSQPYKGMFVSENTSQINYAKLERPNESASTFEIKSKNFGYFTPMKTQGVGMVLQDGVPDARLIPKKIIARYFSQAINHTPPSQIFGYSNSYGSNDLRDGLSSYFKNSRGLNVSQNEILVTQGSQMGLYLASKLLLSLGSKIVMGTPSYYAAENVFRNQGATIMRVKVDKHGMDTDELEILCKKSKIDAVYVTPHHDYPTTVTLRADRRLKLLELAGNYGFPIIEDDYDYDFNYDNAPVFPLASLDQLNNVIYIGSLSKTLSPALRLGYMVAKPRFIDLAAKYRRTVDRQGDGIKEEAVALMLRDRFLESYNRRVKKIYMKRRDSFASLLKSQLGEFFEFEKPVGGMAIWAILQNDRNWTDISEKALQHGLFIQDQGKYVSKGFEHSGYRMGFSTLNEVEIIRVIEILRKSLI
jgi:GntR family transcriptional regulator/MocR family aminotransferase